MVRDPAKDDDGRLLAVGPDGTPRRWHVRDAEGEDLLEYWRRLAPHSNEVLAAEIIDELERDFEDARAVVTEANNSLYGSQGYFLSANGGPADKYHLAKPIEAMKRECNRWYAAAHPYRTAEALKAALAARPAEPTDAMLQAALDADVGSLDTPLRELYRLIYKAMIGAAATV